jgi:AGZA family xanthine/uracil permease-like MFS transporter
MRAWLTRYFQLEEQQTSLRTELLAGLTTFSTMAYILFVNPSILAEAGMDAGAVMVATCLSAGFATLFMGLYAKYPFALAPGMGLNAYFTYGVVLGMGQSWQAALGAVFWSGALFLLLNIVGIRQWIAIAIPTALRQAVAGGMGLFLSFIGLRSVGVIGCHPVTYVCLGQLSSPEALLTGFGLILLTALMARQVLGALFLVILMNWFIGLCFGLVEWQGLVSYPPSLAPTFGQCEIWQALDLHMLAIVFAFLFVDLFDTTGTLVGIAEAAGFLDKKGRLPRTGKAMTADALGTMLGAVLGTSTVTTYLESAAGTAVGGRTGLTACVTGVLFLLALFFAPLVTSIPPFATAPVLVAIGALLLQQVRHIPWEDPTEFIPAYVTLCCIPLTFSVATGIGLGCITFPLCKLLSGRWKEVHPFAWILALVFVAKFSFA